MAKRCFILLRYLINFAIDREGSIPGDVLFFQLLFRRREHGFPAFPVGAAFDVVAKAGDVDYGPARGLHAPTGWGLRRKLLPGRPILASPTATIPASQPELPIHKTESAPGSTFYSMIVKRPGHATVQRAGDLILEAADKDVVSVDNGFLPAVAHTFWNTAVLPTLAKVVANENMTVVPDGKESATFEVAEATDDVVRLAAVEEILEGMLPPIRVGIA